MVTFKALRVGDTFDFIGPNTQHNSVFARFVKTSSRKYQDINDLLFTDGDTKRFYKVGCIYCAVYHVQWKENP